MVASSRFPYHAVARDHGASYGAVLLAAQMLDNGMDHRQLIAGPSPPMWIVATVAAWNLEHTRRDRMTLGLLPSDDMDISGVGKQWKIREGACVPD